MSRTRSWHGEAQPHSLQPVSERVSFVYLEKCKVHREQNAVTATDERGTIYIPVTSATALLLGPGTTISHQAVSLLADSGVTVVWVGREGSRYYAHGRSLSTSSALLMRQAELVVAPRKRLAVARHMYAMRFPGEDVSRLTMQQLRGREGARVRAAYRRESQRTGVEWHGRRYDTQNWTMADSINRSLSSANAVLYGACHSVIVAIGCSPALGFIHTGHQKAFVHDIADLYKAAIAIPCAFQVLADGERNLDQRVRTAMREAVYQGHLLEHAVRDIKKLLGWGEELDDPVDRAQLWDPEQGLVTGGVQYGTDL